MASDANKDPVKCGEAFDLIIVNEINLRLGCSGGPTDEEERQMNRELQEEWLRKAQQECARAGTSCPKPIEVEGGGLLENKCENDIWTIKMLFRTKCVPGVSRKD
jgi:hypothetical protein